jgi:hypothetical protein
MQGEFVLDTTYKRSFMKQLNRHFNDADSTNKSTILYLWSNGTVLYRNPCGGRD